MKQNKLIKAFSVLIAISLLMTQLPLLAFAANDALDLSYKLIITVTDENGTEKTSFQIGETFKVRVSLQYTGAGRAPVYCLQGELHYDPYVIKNTAINEQNGIMAKGLVGQINFAYLDMTGKGQSDSMLNNILDAVFVAKSNGTINLYVDDFILTNKDASERYIDTSNEVKIIVGTGIKDVTKELLEANIAALEKMLAECNISDQTNPGIYYPDFWFTPQAADALQKAIYKA